MNTRKRYPSLTIILSQILRGILALRLIMVRFNSTKCRRSCGCRGTRRFSSICTAITTITGTHFRTMPCSELRRTTRSALQRTCLRRKTKSRPQNQIGNRSKLRSSRCALARASFMQEKKRSSTPERFFSSNKFIEVNYGLVGVVVGAGLAAAGFVVAAAFTG